MNGGYIMIDCSGLDLIKGSTEQTINGIYKKVADAMKKNKPLYCFNAVWGDYGDVSPIQVFAIKTGETITVTSSTLQIVITNQDVITINNLVA